MKPSIITALDIGTSSIKALAVTQKPDSGEFEVLGISQKPSAGIRKGVVVKPEEASLQIQETLLTLQAAINQRIKEVYLNINGSHIFSTPSRGTVIVSRADQKISSEDINRVIQAAQAFSLPPNREIIDVFPKEFIVDGERGIKEALGLQGIRLEAEVILVGVFSPYLRNLTQAVLNSGFQIADITPSPLPSARAVLTPQQKELGVALVEIGAGTTGLAVYEEGNLIHLAVFPVGSANITNDIAIGLKTEIETAERIKKEFGSCLLKEPRKKIKIESNGTPLIFSQKQLGKIIEARVSEIFELIQKELKKISRQGLLPAGVVLTGGGAKLPKIVELAKKELRLPCKVTSALGWIGLEEDPAFSTLSGLGLGEGEFKELGFFSFQKGISNRLKKIFKIFLP